ncbi:MAG: glutamate-1-semialdehyde 2,1-aminomutase [Pseudomonadota bacterium]
MQFETSQHLYQDAKQFIPGGVNSPVRAFKAVGGTPIFFTHGQGAYIFDVDENSYIDYVGSWGPLILGHANPDVVQAVQTYASQGLSFGAPTAIEVDLAKLIVDIVPAVDMIRMVNSGTEASMSAIRLARGATGRDKIIKFNGCYHGSCDGLLASAGSGLLTLAIPSTPGVPKSYTEETLIAEYNDLEQVKQLFQQYGKEIAAVVLEPVAANMNLILPQEGFLAGLRDLCDEFDTLLIFDEVMTGFRIGLSGAGGHYGITPDLSIFGKIIGGGMPVGAYGGKVELMNHIAPAGEVYQAGTLSGNPVAMAAGLATLMQLQQNNYYHRLTENTGIIVEGLRKAAQKHQVPLHISQFGSMFGFVFTEATEITRFNDVKESNINQFKHFFHALIQQGIYIPPSAFEVCFVSTCHCETEIEKTLSAFEQAIKALG